jgi:hypothetical protein
VNKALKCLGKAFKCLLDKALKWKWKALKNKAFKCQALKYPVMGKKKSGE